MPRVQSVLFLDGATPSAIRVSLLDFTSFYVIGASVVYVFSTRVIPRADETAGTVPSHIPSFSVFFALIQNFLTHLTVRVYGEVFRIP